MVSNSPTVRLKYKSPVFQPPRAKIKIEVLGDHARLFVQDQQPPTLIVNDVKSGAEAKGAIALWIGPSTVAHFRNLRVAPIPSVP
jgi:hypothetical protein